MISKITINFFEKLNALIKRCLKIDFTFSRRAPRDNRIHSRHAPLHSRITSKEIAEITLLIIVESSEFMTHVLLLCFRYLI